MFLLAIELASRVDEKLNTAKERFYCIVNNAVTNTSKTVFLKNILEDD